MRLFVAVPLPITVGDILFSFQKSLRSLPAKLSLVAKKNLHLTLKFLGEVDALQQDIISSRLSQISFIPFSLSISSLGLFPGNRYPRVLWVGLSPEKPLISLQRQIDETLLDLFPTTTSFSAHLTLARVRLLKDPKTFSETFSSLESPSTSFQVSSFCLYSSILRPSGPTHRILETYA
ncbi:RNA 2',3'-cyclic phosphodiesterase [Candidatus Woesearchaeota archaeon]|nr:RNA 2',3'-cyclic phosphodiesterase [Candidatus Woesearchaeota archaeon]